MADVDHESTLVRSEPRVKRKLWDSAAVDHDLETHHALVFSIAEQRFAIAADFIEQIVELPRVSEVSSTPCLLGLTHHAGQPIPVVDISPLLNLPIPAYDSAQSSLQNSLQAVGRFRHGLLLNHQRWRVMLAIETVVVLRDLSAQPRLEVPADYQSFGFVEYVCELSVGDDNRGNSNTGTSSLRTAQRGAAAGNNQLVVVLEVSKFLLSARNSAAVGKPV